MVPVYLDVFISPIRDNQVAQIAVAAVLILIVLDILFGLCNAIANHEYSSEKMRHGIGHKCAEIGFILVGMIVDGTVVGGFDIGFPSPVLVSVCVYLCLMEIGSLLETFASMNPQLADSPLFRVLESAKLKAGESDGEDD